MVASVKSPPAPSTATPPTTPPLAGLGAPILIVDDSVLIGSIVQTLLGKLGYQNVDRVTDVPAAFTQLRVRKYALLLSDWNMEPISGHTFLKELRADPALKATPFIMMTAEASSEKVIAAKKAGVDGYIVKPFTASALKAKIDGVLAFT
jgi:two-component system chemotaxis response regulator CheY